MRDAAAPQWKVQGPDRPQANGPDTKQRLLDAAERLFAERGFEGTSMRAVTQAAGVAVSAANYHFGSKLSLLGETLRRRIRPFNQRRLELLDSLEAGAAQPGVEQILDAYFRPPFERAANVSDEQRALLRDVAACLWHNPPEIAAALRAELFSEVTERFGDALGRALPEARPERVAMLLQLSVGLLVHALNGEGASFSSADSDALRIVLVRYAAAGMTAAAREGQA